MDGITVERRSAEETFGLLGNEIRVAILQALAEEPGESHSFSALREAVGEPDSGKFNYHLRKLEGQFVTKTEAGYELSIAGGQVVGALIAGTYTADVEMAPIDIEDPCPVCGEAGLTMEYADERAVVKCNACDEFQNQFTFPPGTVDQFDRAELPAAVDRWLWATLSRVRKGFCPTCGGRIEGSLAPAEESETAMNRVRAAFECPRCGTEVRTALGLITYFHPGVMGFFYDHGIDLTAEPTWALPTLQDDYSAEFESEDPPTARLSIELDGETATLVLDESLTVTRFERSSN